MIGELDEPHQPPPSGRSRIENLFVAHVLPLVLVEDLLHDQYKPLRVLGTAFTFGEGTLLTCQHLVDRQLGDNEVIAVVRREGLDTQSYTEIHPIPDFQRDTGGADIAFARAPFRISPQLSLAPEPPDWGGDVIACGYPHPSASRDAWTRELSLEISATLLRGYVTRTRMSDDPHHRSRRSFELDMPAPPGLSGAPLFQADGSVIGMVGGEHATTVGSATTYHFSWAVHLSPLRHARCGLTMNLPLSEHLARSPDPEALGPQ